MVISLTKNRPNWLNEGERWCLEGNSASFHPFLVFENLPPHNDDDDDGDDNNNNYNFRSIWEWSLHGGIAFWCIMCRYCSFAENCCRIEEFVRSGEQRARTGARKPRRTSSYNASSALSEGNTLPESLLQTSALPISQFGIFVANRIPFPFQPDSVQHRPLQKILFQHWSRLLLVQANAYFWQISGKLLTKRPWREPT